MVVLLQGELGGVEPPQDADGGAAVQRLPGQGPNGKKRNATQVFVGGGEPTLDVWTRSSSELEERKEPQQQQIQLIL